MKTMHLFAGVGGGLLADLILGHEPIVAVEWDAYCCQVLRERAADGWFRGLRVHEGDIRLFDPSDYTGRVDCIHAGFPCQDVSVAGNRAGLGDDTRSGLYREVLRIAGIVRPHFLFLENVTAILSGGLGTILGDLAARGYDARWTCLPASATGAPHYRDRWWCLAERTDAECVQSSERRGFEEVRGRSAEAKQARLVGGYVADTLRDGLQGLRNPISGNGTAGASARGEASRGASEEGGDWWAIEPGLDRVVDGIPNRAHRIKALGNAQVPLQAAVAWRLLGGP